MPIEFVGGNSPVLLTIPYAGTVMHKRIVDRLVDDTQCATAPDRHLGRLLNGLHGDLNLLSPKFHRFLSDVDCVIPAPQLSTAKTMVGVVPLLCPKGKSIWRRPPDIREATRWRAIWYAPYHAVLAAQIACIRAKFGHVVVINCRARAQNTSQGDNLNTADITVSSITRSPYSANFTAGLMSILKTNNNISFHMNGPTSTGWLPRQNGPPKTSVQALDLEFNELCYLTEDEHSGLFNTALAKNLQDALQQVMAYAVDWRPH
ncbi:MAG: N-formylglutamate amidohydrolase [Roseobacter sp.]